MLQILVLPDFFERTKAFWVFGGFSFTVCGPFVLPVFVDLVGGLLSDLVGKSPPLKKASIFGTSGSSDFLVVLDGLAVLGFIVFTKY